MKRIQRIETGRWLLDCEHYYFLSLYKFAFEYAGDDQSEVKSTSLIMSPSSKSSAVANKKFLCNDDECCSCCISSTTSTNNNNVADKNHLHMSTILGEDVKIFFFNLSREIFCLKEEEKIFNTCEGSDVWKIRVVKMKFEMEN